MKKNDGADDERADGDDNRSDTECAIQLVRDRRAWIERRRNGPCGAATNLKRDKGGNGQHQKNGQRDQKARLDGENRRGEHRRDRQHGEKREIAIGARRVQAHERREQHQVDRREQRGVKRRIWRAFGQIARDDPKIHGKNRK